MADKTIEKKPNFFTNAWAKIKKFFSDLAGEMKKIAWMPKNELKKSTLLVIVAVLAVSAAIGIVDTLFGWIINLIAGLIG
jgi:preprotein translocase subunit SecE